MSRTSMKPRIITPATCQIHINPPNLTVKLLHGVFIFHSFFLEMFGRYLKYDVVALLFIFVHRGLRLHVFDRKGRYAVCVCVWAQHILYNKQKQLKGGGKSWTKPVNILLLLCATPILSHLYTGLLTFTFRIFTNLSSTRTASLPPSALSLWVRKEKKKCMLIIIIIRCG